MDWQQRCILEARCLTPSISGIYPRTYAESSPLWSCISGPTTARARGAGSPLTPAAFMKGTSSVERALLPQEVVRVSPTLLLLTLSSGRMWRGRRRGGYTA